MLQQTQVERVIPFYAEFTKRFPTVQKLADASLADVLKIWQGLGYNRRAKMLQQAAKEIVAKHKSKFPQSVEELEKLPGIGPYTARAVAAFAYNQDVIFIETNIRTAVIHHFYPRKKKVSDKEITKILEEALPIRKSRDWYAALMDYGAHLKRSGIKLNTKSKHYAKQSKFAGSNREARGAILKELAKGAATQSRLLGLLGDDRRTQLRSALSSLLSESLIEKRGNRFQLPR
jgi:A/G-specific adenine glycosylase